jgi:hypothetical protein
MRRRLTALVAMSMFVLALGATPTLAASPASANLTGPTLHASFPAEGTPAYCGPYTYIVGGGTMEVDYKLAALSIDADGNLALAASHFTFRAAWATRLDDPSGTIYRVVGGETFTDPAGRGNLHIKFISPSGGVADRATFVWRAYSHGGVGFQLDKGTCLK